MGRETRRRLNKRVAGTCQDSTDGGLGARLLSKINHFDTDVAYLAVIFMFYGYILVLGEYRWICRCVFRLGFSQSGFCAVFGRARFFPIRS